MSAPAVCPQCQRQLQVTDEAIGQPVKCPGCNTAFRPPATAAGPVAPERQPARADEAATRQRNATPEPGGQGVLRQVRDRGQAAGQKKSGAGTVLSVLAAVGLLLLLVCGGVGYWVWTRVRVASTAFQESLGRDPFKAAPVAGTPGAPQTGSGGKPDTRPAPPANSQAGGKPVDFEEAIKQAGAGKKLAPVEVTLGGVTFTLLAPEGSKVGKSGRDASIYKNYGGGPALYVRPGRIDLPTAKEIWKALPDEKFKSLPIDTPDLVLREFVTKGSRHVEDGTHYRFVLNARFGYLDVHFTNTYASLDDCLLLIHCARSAALKEQRPLPASAADLEKAGVVFSREGEKIKGVGGLREAFTDAMLAALVKLLPDLEELNLINADVSDDGLRVLAGMKNLRVLYFPHPRALIYNGCPDVLLNGSGFAHLGGLKKLERLVLSDLPLRDEALAPLKGLTGLKYLFLNGTTITGSGMAHLAGLDNLEELSLATSRFGDDGVKHLAGLKKLKTLSLEKTRVTGAGFADFAGLPEMRELYISFSKFDDRGLKGLAGMKELRKLQLYDTQVTGHGFADLKGLKELVEINLRASPVDDVGVRELGEMPSLTVLQLEDSKVTDGGLPGLKGLTNLTVLNLNNTAVKGTGLGELRALSRLDSLELNKAPLTDDGLKELGKLTGLKRLMLNEAPLTDGGLRHLAGLKQLEGLSLVATKVTDAGLKQIGGLEKLTYLNLDKTAVTDVGLEHLKGLKSLFNVSLMETKVTKAGVEGLKKALPKVTVYYTEK